MKNNKRKGRFNKTVAVLLIICMLPLSGFSELKQIIASEETKFTALGRELGENAETTTGPAVSIEPAITAEPAKPQETKEALTDVKPEETFKPEEKLEKEAAVLNLTCTRGEEGVLVLHWNLLPCMEGDTITYQIYRDTSLQDSIEDETYTDTLAEGKSAVYQVTAYSSLKGEIIAESNEVTVMPAAVDWVVEKPFTMEQDMTVKSLTVKAGLHLNGHKLTVERGVLIEESGLLYIDSGFLECKGDFLNQDGFFRMYEEAGYVLIHGDFTTGYNLRDLESGTLEVKGDFSILGNYDNQTGNFLRIIISGEQRQRISPGKNIFGSFEIQNSSEEGVLLDEPVRSVSFHSNGSRISFKQEEEYRIGWMLSEDQTIEGDVKLFGDTLDLNGHTLVIKGDLIQSGGDVKVNGGSLIIEGNYRLIDIPGSGLSGNYGRLIMQSETDYVKVEGSFETRSKMGTEGFLTNGVLELKGDMIKVEEDYGRINGSNFCASDEHTVTFSGNESQAIYSYPDSPNIRKWVTFQDLEFKNQIEEGISINGLVTAKGIVKSNGKKIAGILEINSDLPIDGLCYSGVLFVSGKIRNLEMTGDLHIKKETAVLGELKVNGNLYNDSSLVMDTNEAYITVAGSYIQNGNTEASAGTIEVKGNFEIQCGDFLASGLHKVILSGKKKQNIINISLQRLKFQTLELKNNGDGVDVAGIMEVTELIKNQTRLTYGGQELLPGQVLKNDMVLEMGVTLSEDLDLNGHSLTIKGDLIHTAGKLNMNGGSLIVEGDYRQQTVIQGQDGASYEGCQSSLIMQDEKDFFRIEGSFFASSREYTDGLLTNGTLELRGDLIATESHAFQGSGEHRLILNGSHRQTVNTDWHSISIANLIIDNTSDTGINLGNSVLQISGYVRHEQGKMEGKLALLPTAQIQGVYPGNITVKQEGEIQGDWHIGGDFILQQKIVLTGSVTVDGNFYIEGNWPGVVMKGGRFLVTKDACFENMDRYGYFSMSDSRDYFKVDGNWYIGENWRISLTAGLTELKGDLKGSHNRETVNMSGTHKLLLSGERKQTVELNDKYDSIHILELKNFSEEGVCFINPVSIDQIIKNGCHLSYGDDSEKYGWSLQEDQVVEGDLYLLADDLDLNGYCLTVKGNLIQANGTIRINGGKLIVEKDYRTQRRIGSGESVTYGEGYGTLELIRPEDYVLIKGDFVDGSRLNGTLKAGTLELWGNYHKVNKIGQPFKTEPGLLVLFNGEQKQKAWADSVQAIISSLEIGKKKETPVEFGDGFTIKDMLCTNGNSINGALSIYGSTALDFEIYDEDVKITGEGVMGRKLEVMGKLTVLSSFTLEAPLKVHGDVTIQEGCLTIESGSLTAERNVEIVKPPEDTSEGMEEYALKMTNDGAAFRVEGNYTDSSDRKTLWEKGSLLIKGNVSFSSKCLLKQEEGHKLILNGNNLQILNIKNPDCFLSYLELQNSSQAGVDLVMLIPILKLVKNGNRLTYDGEEGRRGWTLDGDQVIEGELTLTGGTLDLNGHTLTVKGNLDHMNGNIRLNKGQLVVEGFYEMENTGKSSLYGKSYGRLEMTNARDYVLVKGGMYIESHKSAISTLTDGILELQGGFNKYNDSNTFPCSGNHTVILSINQYCTINTPTGFQNLINRSSYPTVSVRQLSVAGKLSDEAQNFNKGQFIEMKDPSGIDDHGFSGSLRINQAFTCSRDFAVAGTVEINTDVNLEGHMVTAGQIKAFSGTITLGGGTIQCQKDFWIMDNSRIQMEEPTDYLLVGGGFYYYGKGRSILTNGTLELKSAFYDSSDTGFWAEGEHRTILNPPEQKPGDEPYQTSIEFFNTTVPYGFQTLVLYRPEREFAFSHPVEELCKELLIDIHGYRPPEIVTGIRVERATATGLTLAWDEPPAWENVKHYEIYRDGIKVGVSGTCHYEDRELRPENTYAYKVYALDTEGGRSEASEELLAGTPPDQEPPETPRNLLLQTRTGSSVTFSWSPSKDNVETAGYEIYRNGTRIEALFTGTSYKDTKAVRNGGNVYEVAAVDTAGNVSEKSGELSAVVAMPRILSITPEDGRRFGGEETELTIRFQDVGNSTGNTVQIELLNGEGEWVSLTEAPLPQNRYNSEEFRVSHVWKTGGLKETGEVTLRYTLTDADGNQDQRTVTYRIDHTPPVTPGNVSVHTDNGLVVLSWNPSISADCVYYTVYRKAAEAGEEDYQRLACVEGRFETKYIDKEVEPGKTYIYRITASDDFDQESRTAEAGPVTVEADGVAPSLLSLLPEAGRVNEIVKVTVTASDNLSVTAIQLSCRTVESEKWEEIGEEEAEGGKALLSWDTAKWEGACELRAIAVDAAGNESEPVIRRYVVDHTGPAAIRLKDARTGDTWIQLFWEDVTEPDFGRFVVEEKKNGRWEKAAETTDTLGATLSGLKPGGTYTYRVVGYDDLGNRGIPSEELTCNTKEDTTAPVIRRIGPESTYYRGIVTLFLEVSDNYGGGHARFSWSYDKQSWKTIAQPNAGPIREETRYTVPWQTDGLREGSVYVRFEAWDGAGHKNREENGPICVEYRIDRTAPGKVAHVTAEGKEGLVSLAWDEAKETDLACYRIYRAKGEAGTYQLLESDWKGRNYFDTKVEPGEIYRYELEAVDLAGNIGPRSEPVLAQAAADTQAPRILGISPSGGETTGAGTIIRIWAADNCSLGTVQAWYRKAGEEDGVWKNLLEQPVSGTDKLCEKAFPVDSLAEGNYEIKACVTDRAGNRSDTAEEGFFLDRTAPEATGLKAERGGRKIGLSWRGCTEEDFSHYELYRQSAYDSGMKRIMSLSEVGYEDTEVIPETVYTYQLKCVDQYGNVSWTERITGTASSEDTTAPVARVPEEIVGVAGMELALDGTGSTDNVRIVSYRWELGNGEHRTGIQPVYVYEKPGVYVASLTVKDGAGNQDTAVTRITILSADQTGSVKVRVTDPSGRALAHAYVYLKLSEEERRNLRTDARGYVNVAATAGTYQIAAYQEGYLPKEETVDIRSYEDGEKTIVLEPGEVVVGDLQVRRMDLKEIEEAGIDCSDPANYHSYVFHVELTFAQEPIPTYREYVYIGGTKEVVVKTDGKPEEPGGTSSGSGEMSGVSLAVYQEEASGEEAPVLVYLRTPDYEISWLKDLYVVELGVINQAAPRFVIEDAKARLSLPDGLSLAGTKNGQELLQPMGDIPGQEQKNAVWYIRGDRPGSYEIQASLDGIMQPFGAQLHRDFFAREQVEATAGEGLHLYLMPEDSAYIGKEYYVQFALRNESNHAFYNLKTTLGPYQDPGYEEDIKITDKETGEIIRQGSREPARFLAEAPSRCESLPVLRGGDELEIGTFQPGETIYGTYSQIFHGEGEPDEVYYRLCETLAEEVKGANLGVQVSVLPVPSHILRYNVDVYTIGSRLWADPVDVATGAFQESYEALSVTGGTKVALELTYQSRQTSQEGEMGYGWSHPYEIGVTEKNGVAELSWSPEHKAVFVRKEAVNREVRGTVINGQIVPDTADEKGKASYVCLSSGMEGYRLERDETGRYMAHGPEGEQYAFDREGRLTRLENADGKSVTVRYEPGQRTVTDTASGRYLQLHYDKEGHVAEVTDGEGRRTRFTYEAGYLTSITNPLGEKTSYRYDGEGRLVSVADGAGVAYVENTYDSQGRVLTQKDGNGHVTTFSYEDKKYGGQITHVTDRNGETLEAETDRQGNLIRTKDQNGAVQRASYNGEGLLQSERDGEGNVVYYEYDGAGRVTQVRDAGLCTIRYRYDGAGNLTEIAGEGESTARYTYDGAGRMTKAERTGYGTTTYEYDGRGNLVRETTEGKGSRRYRYDKGQLTEETDWRGNTSRWTYDGRGNLIEATDRTGGTTRYAYDALNRPIRVTDPSGCVTEYRYDSRGNVAGQTVDGETTRYTYDRNRLPIEEERPDGSRLTYGYDREGRLTRVTGPDGRSERTEYDGAGNAIRITGWAGDTSVYTYDANGRRTSETGPDGQTVRYTYYPNGKLQKETYGDGETVLYTYNRNWELLVVTNGEQSLSYEYDSAGRVSAERDGEGNTVRYGYDGSGNVAEEVDANGNRTVYAYDGNGNCVRRTDALGFETEYRYDGENRLTEIEAHTKAGMKKRTFVYDRAGRLTETVDEAGNHRKTAYDRQGRVTEETDALGRLVAAYTYDSLGRLQSIRDAGGQETTYTYDSGDRLSRIKEPGKPAAVWTRSYDASGRLEAAGDPLKGESRVSYDEAGRLAELYNPLGGRTTYTYDERGRLAKEQVSGTGAVTYRYGRSGQATERKNGRGQKTGFTYDRAGRLVKRTDPEGEVRYTYDGNGNVLTVTDQTGTITRKYDGLNRVTRYTDSRGRSVEYSYDELGNVIALTYPGGEIVRYTYDAAGNMETVTDAKGRRTRYCYDGNGRLVKTERPDGTQESRSYDAWGRLTRQTDRKGNQVMREASYGYDAAGNLTEIREEKAGSAAEAEAVEMSYDANNRLKTWNGEPVHYDADGNMTYGPVEGRMCELVYDSRNRLIRAGETRYEYDAENVRTAVIEGGVRTELLTDPEASLPRVLLAVETDETGEESQTRYVYGNGLLSEESQERGYLLYHFDQVGSTTVLTDEKGEVKREYTYGPYGEPVSGEREGIRFLYNGKYGVETDENGLCYMRARYYSTELRRFVNRDVLEGSVTRSGSLNRYAYVEGNPVSLTDPFGLSPLSDPGVLGHSLLGLLGCIPGGGELADGLNAIWYFVEGDSLNGWASLASALPGLGTLAGKGIRLAFGKSGRVLSLAKLVEDGSRLVGHGVTFGQAAIRGLGTAQGMYEKYYVRGEKAGLGTVLEAGAVLLDVATCITTGKSIRGDLQEAARSFRNAGQELWSGRQTSGMNAQPVLRMDLQTFAEGKKTGNTYYQVTSRENAANIMKTGQLTGKEFKEVYVWSEQPTLKQAKASGARDVETVISFQTNAAFIKDETVFEKLQKTARVSLRPGPISIDNIIDVGFRKGWWEFWKK